MKQLLKIAGFIALAALGIQQALERHNAKTWPSVEGVITTSHVSSRTGTRHADDPGRRVSYTYYEVQVGYQYEVGGVRYSGGRAEFDPTKYSSRRNAEKELVNYPAGKTVAVYYDPMKPDKSTLKR